MSLLNDALKKKEQETQIPDVPSHLLGLQDEGKVEKTQPKKLFLTLLAILVVFSAGLSYGILKYSSSQIRPKVLSIGKSNITTNKEVTQTAPGKNEESKTGNSIKTITTEKKVLAENSPEKGLSNEHVVEKAEVKQPQEVGNTAENEKSREKATATKKAQIAKKGHKLEVKQTTPKVVTREKPVSVTTTKKKKAVESFFITAARYQRDGRVHEAIRIYKSILKRYPQNRKARLNLGAAYLQVGQYSAALNIMEKLYNQYPNDPRVLLDYSIVLVKFGRLEEALQCIELAEKKGGPRYEVLLNKGIVLRKLGKISQAIDAYREASYLRPNDPRLQYNMAIVYDAAGSYREATRYYKSFLDNPEHDTKKDVPVRQRLQQLYAYLNRIKQEQYTRN